LTLIEQARAGKIPQAIEMAAADENIDPEKLRELVACGRVVICQNKLRPNLRPLAIGESTHIKVNANIGTSVDCASIEMELQKLDVAEKAGADTVMDLSTGGDIDAVREAIIAKSKVPIGTVPIYQCMQTLRSEDRPVFEMTGDDLFAAIEKHARDGVDFVTVHCGVTQESTSYIRRQKRKLGIVSRGGAYLARWIRENDCENPLFEQYDRLLELAREYEMVLSLGDGLRPGCLADATDRGQVAELIILGDLVRRARVAGVQTMVEGPGHVPLDQVETNIKLQKSICDGAPFYVLGPLVTDIAPGFDHITGAIGGAVAAMYGADYLCYVTPAEHLRLPDLDDVRAGTITSRIAAHAGDIARGLPGARDADDRMANARAKLDWEGQIAEAIDPELAKSMRDELLPADSDVCTMCGSACAIKMSDEEKTPGTK
jgi:phosphomethylpyrimidine synthase